MFYTMFVIPACVALGTLLIGGRREEGGRFHSTLVWYRSMTRVLRNVGSGRGTVSTVPLSHGASHV